MAKAIASSGDREGEPVFFPHEGTTFSSYEEAKEFYNLYSWEVGFGIREWRSKTNANNYTTRKDIVCSCEVWTQLRVIQNRDSVYLQSKLNDVMIDYYQCRDSAETQEYLRHGRVAKQCCGCTGRKTIPG
jgi:hypothetical protein